MATGGGNGVGAVEIDASTNSGLDSDGSRKTGNLDGTYSQIIARKISSLSVIANS